MLLCQWIFQAPQVEAYVNFSVLMPRCPDHHPRTKDLFILYYLCYCSFTWEWRFNLWKLLFTGILLEKLPTMIESYGPSTILPLQGILIIPDTIVSPQNLHCVNQRKILLLRRRKCPHTDKNLPCTDTGDRGPINGRSGRNPTSHGVGDPVLFREWTHLNWTHQFSVTRMLQHAGVLCYTCEVSQKLQRHRSLRDRSVNMSRLRLVRYTPSEQSWSALLVRFQWLGMWPLPPCHLDSQTPYRASSNKALYGLTAAGTRKWAEKDPGWGRQLCLQCLESTAYLIWHTLQFTKYWQSHQVKGSWATDLPCSQFAFLGFSYLGGNHDMKIL